MAVGPRPVKLTARQERLAEMIRLYDSGLSTTEVGRAVGVDPSWVSRSLRAAGVTMRPRKRARNAQVSYSGAHMRVRSDRGSATSHTCACGRRAAQWAYTHDDPDELTSPEGTYSADPARYVALCVPCHKRADLARIKEGRWPGRKR